MIRRRPILTLAACTGGVAAYSYYRLRTQPPATFQLAYRVRDGSGNLGTATTTLPLLSEDEVNERIRQSNAEHSTTDRKGRKWIWHTAQLGSNDPIEDALAYSIVQKPKADGTYMFFSVMDGHGGPWTSRLLSKVLIPAVALEMELPNLYPDRLSPVDPDSILGQLKSFIKKNPFAAVDEPLWQRSEPPDLVSLAMRRAFHKVDREIIDAPLRLSSKSREQLSLDPMVDPTLLPSRSGSCALLALIDTETEDLHVACTGDCRAIVGYVDPLTGECTVEELTEDQTAGNPREVARIRDEHPSDETETVVKRGRVLGGLEPSRAFGDARYKWSLEAQIKLAGQLDGLVEQPMRPPPLHLKTPPYVTCNPEVTRSKLTFEPSESAQPFRFLVLATDGLWDELSSKEVAALVWGHLKGYQGNVPKDTIGVDSRMETRSSRYNAGQSPSNWMFKDDNVAAHLIRNAFGCTRSSPDQLRRLLSIPSPLSRRFRDDTTVLVVWWESDTKSSNNPALLQH